MRFKKRYFIVNFEADKELGMIKGNINFTSNGYINRRKTEERISEFIQCENVVITNIIELSKKDYKDWTN